MGFLKKRIKIWYVDFFLKVLDSFSFFKILYSLATKKFLNYTFISM